jgi:hypothetical protein
MTTPHTATDQPVALLRKKLASNDVLDLTVQDLGSQQFRAVVNRVLSNRICGFPANLAAIVFVGSPGHMGDVTLTDGQRALVFIRKVGDRYYEDPWHGHLTLEPFEDRLVAVAAWHLDESGLAFGPEYLRQSAFTPDKSRAWRTAFPLELIERHLSEELGILHADR